MIACLSMSNAFSSAANGFDNLDKMVLESNIRTNTYGSPQYMMNNRIEEVFAECSADGWDGYDAIAISPETKKYAFAFSTCIPADVPTPEFGADPDGHLSLEWFIGPRKVVTVSVSPDGVLYYAALVGYQKINGSAFLASGFPRDLYNLIRRVISE